VSTTGTPPVRTSPATNDRARWIALIVLCVGMLMIILDSTVVNVALPSIQHDLGFSQPNLAWVVNAYLITFGGLLLLAGRLGDLVGRRFGPKATLLPGLAMPVAGLAWLARAPVDAAYATNVLPSMILIGAGAGISFPSLMTLAMSGANAGAWIISAAVAGAALLVASVTLRATPRVAEAEESIAQQRDLLGPDPAYSEAA